MRRHWIGCIALACPLMAAQEYLIIDRLSQKAGVVLYELPEAEGREEAVRHIEGTANGPWNGAEIVDASVAGEEFLRQKCRATCVLYTTIGEQSKALQKATAGMGWAVRDGVFRWRKVAMPLAETRFILAGRNPFGEGHLVVYAAGSNRELVNINSVRHGGASFHVYRGKRLVYEGLYGADLTPRETVSGAGAVEDVEQFFATLERVHPNLLAKMSHAEYTKLRQRTLEGLGSRGEIAIGDLASWLYYAAAQFGDGHTSVQWRTKPTAINAAEQRFPAFRLAFDNGRFVIAAASDKRIEGNEVVAINGTPVREFLRPILQRCSGETLVFKAARFTSEEGFWYYLTKLLGNAESLALTLRDEQGQEWRVTAATLDIHAYLDFLERGTPGRVQPNQRGTDVEFLDDGAVAHFMYQSFRLNDAEKKKVDGVFAQVRAKGSGDLIIDLRGNGGGNSSMGDLIFSYLYDGKFRQYSASAVKLSPEIRQYIQGWKKGAAAADGTVLKEAVPEKKTAKREAAFTGRKYLLVDNGTFSSAADFAAMFRDYGVGTILGYETGGLAVSYGDVYSFALKNSWISCGVSWKQFFGPKPRKGDDEHGVEPDVPMNAKVLAEFGGAADPVLAATVRYVRERQKREAH